jgi:hypothetical protein
MKKFAISLLALAALSTASFAADSGSNSNNQHDSDAYFIRYSSQLKAKAASANAMTVIKKIGTSSSFDSWDRTAWEEDRGGNN